jgi:hypothetical protein
LNLRKHRQNSPRFIANLKKRFGFSEVAACGLARLTQSKRTTDNTESTDKDKNAFVACGLASRQLSYLLSLSVLSVLSVVVFDGARQAAESSRTANFARY